MAERKDLAHLLGLGPGRLLGAFGRTMPLQRAGQPSQGSGRTDGLSGLLPIFLDSNYTARRQADVLTPRSFLLCLDVLKERIYIIIESGSVLVTHCPDFIDDRVGLRLPHSVSPLVRSGCK